ncbi:DMT family transporter [Actinocorallia longicatena]|uniref:DMT family transporter n=1 Tax=Actinocorallia longicatena TaxID=111803 RepID=A0ABP6QMK4_9ACTN
MRRALLLAFLGVLSFSFTFPGTLWALDGLGPYLVAIGRAVLAAAFAATALTAVHLGSRRSPSGSRLTVPRGRQWRGLAIVGVGVVFGFPVLSTLALDFGASSAHAAVVIGLLPAATAIAGVVRAGERAPWRFWLAAACGALCVTLFTVTRGDGGFGAQDLLLVGALLLAAVGYAEGGALAREMPAWQVICWALVLWTPVTVPATLWLLATTDPHWTGRAAAGFLYVSAFSMFLGFFAWYAGLARAGIARASQIQLLQPLLTLVWSAWLLHERLDWATGLTAVAVVACVAWTQRSRTSAPARPAAPAPLAVPR